MKPSIKDYFHFNKSERRGTIALIVIIVLVIVIKELLIYINPNPPLSNINMDSLQQIVEMQLQQREIEVEDSIDSQAVAESIDSIELFDFNPNNLPLETWEKLGLSKKQAETIKNYEAKGGSFQVKADVQKMYTVSEELYAKLEPFILLPDSFPRKEYSSKTGDENWETKTWKKEKRVYPKVLINSADTAEFKKLYGIGDYYAQKIVEHREALGGFVSKNQLKEIWGLKPETLQRLDTQLVFNVVPVQKININTASVDELKAHPYIFWKVANSIVKYREQHGSYAEVNEIKQSALVSDSLFLKIAPYLKY